MTPQHTTYSRILAAVKRIPKGRVATYGQIARLAGFPRQPRLTGYALRNADDRVPWHRVVNASGTISARAQSDSERLQRRLLQSEGVQFDGKGRIRLKQFQWRPRARQKP